MRQLQTREAAPQIARSAPSPAQTTAGGGFTGKDFFRVLRKRKILIGLILAVITGLFVGGTILWRQLMPGYQAEAFVLVRMSSPKPDQPDAISFANINSQTQEHILNTRAQEILSPAVMRAASSTDAFQKTTWYKKHGGRVVDKLMEEVKVSPSPKSLFIVVSMDGYGDYFKDDLPVIVNEISRAAVQASLSSAVGTMERVRSALNAEQKDLQDDLIAAKRDLQNANNEGSKIGGFTDRADLLKREIASRSEKLLEAQVEYNQISAAFREYQQLSQNGQLPRSPAVETRVQANPVVYNLRLQADGLEREYLALKKSHGNNHRQVIATKARWDAAMDQLHSKQSEVEQREAQALMDEYAMLQSNALSYIEKLEDEIEIKEQQLEGIAGEMVRVVQLEQDIENMQDQYNRLQTTLMEFDLVAGEGRVLEPMSLSQPARTPERISSPRYTIMVPLGVFLGLALGVGLAFLLEFTDSSVKSPSDLARRVDLPLLGMVPHLDDIDDEIKDVRLAGLTNPNSLISEAFRQIRTNVLFSGPAESRKTLLITSASPEDGRSTVATNIAATMTAGGRKVLLIDANFRQPAMNRLFANCPEGGLSSALVGEGKWEDLTAEVEPGLWVMGSGPLPPNPAELLDSEQMQQLLRDMSGQFDQVIIDGPPSMVVTDASILAGLSDGVVLVVRAGDNTYGLVQRCRSNLERVGAHILGAVLNGVRVSAGGYLRRNYTTFYDYHAQGRLPSKTSS